MRRLGMSLLMMMVLCGCLHAQTRHTFENGVLGPEWHYLGVRDSSKYCFQESKLRLKGSIYELREEKPVTFVGLPVTSDVFQADTKLTLLDAENGDEAGICFFVTRQGYVQCCLNNFQGNRRLKLRLQLLSHRLLIFDHTVGMMSEVWLRVKSNGKKLLFYYSTDGKKYHWIEGVEKRLLDNDVVGGEAPGLIGMYAYMGSTKYNTGYTYGDFDFFDYQE